MPRQPISVDDQPREEIARLVRDEVRATYTTYNDLITTAGISAAEKWIALLAWDRALGWPGSHEGWYLAGTAEAERFARRRHPRASAAVLALSLREYDAIRARYHATARYKAISGYELGPINDRDIISL